MMYKAYAEGKSDDSQLYVERLQQ